MDASWCNRIAIENVVQIKHGRQFGNCESQPAPVVLADNAIALASAPALASAKPTGQGRADWAAPSRAARRA